MLESEQEFRAALATAMPGLSTNIVKRSGTAKGVEPLPRRWVVERALAGINRGRGLENDFENLTCMAVAFIEFAAIRLMVRTLSNPKCNFADRVWL